MLTLPIMLMGTEKLFLRPFVSRIGQELQRRLYDFSVGKLRIYSNDLLALVLKAKCCLEKTKVQFLDCFSRRHLALRARALIGIELPSDGETDLNNVKHLSRRC